MTSILPPTATAPRVAASQISGQGTAAGPGAVRRWPASPRRVRRHRRRVRGSARLLHPRRERRGHRGRPGRAARQPGL